MNLRGTISEEINIFPLCFRGQPLLQHLCVIRHKDRYLPAYIRYFQELIEEYFQKIENLPNYESILQFRYVSPMSQPE